jgi:hypothetical protein
MNVILAQLLALRAQLDAAIAIVESVSEPEGGYTPSVGLPPPGNGCLHPADRQVDASTFAGPFIQCLDCTWKRPGTVPA